MLAAARSTWRTRSATALAVLTLAAACSSIGRRASGPTASANAAPRLSLDPEASPLSFRWLSDDAVLVPPATGKRKLAAFGNYVARAAKGIARSNLSLWDDEQAWTLATAGKGGDDEVLAHRRAEFVKDTGAAEPVEHFLVFSREGEVIYQRDFRSWPLTELD